MPGKPSYEQLEKEVRNLREAQKSLLEDQLNLQSITSTALDSIFIKDARRRYTFVNPAMARLFRCAAKDLLGKRPEDIFGPKDADVVKDADERTLQGENVSETARLSINQKPIFFHTIQTPIRDPQGQVTGITGIVRDITDDKRLEVELRSERDRAQRYLDLAGVMFVAIDSQARVTLINRKGLEILGYQEEEILGKNWFDICLPEDVREKVREVSRRILSGDVEPAEYYENHVLTKSGEKRLIAWHNVDLRDAEGRVIGHLSSGEDITDRRQAEKAQEESVQRFQALSRAAFEAIFISEKGICIDQNQAAQELFGYSRKEAVGKPGTDWIVPEDRDLVKNNMLSGYEKAYEAKALRKDGSTFPAEIQGRMFDHQGKLLRITALRDITERKSAEEALRTNEAKFRAIFNQTYQFTGLLDTEGRTLMANESALDFGGLVESDVVGQYFWETAWWTHDAKQQDVLRDAVGRAAKGELVRFEAWHLGHDETIRHVDFSIKPVEDDTGKIIFLLPEGRDITERKKMEETLRESEQRFRTIFEQAAVGVALIESETGRFLRINRRYCEMIGYTMEEMSGGRTFQEITHPEDLQLDLDNMARLLSGEIGQFTMEKRYIHKNGNIVWVNLTVSPTWAPEEKPRHHIAVVEDITEAKKAEAALRESEERYRSMIEGIADPVYVCSKDFTVELMNSAMRKRVGYDAIGDKCYKAIHDLDGQCPHCVHEKVQQGETCFHEIQSHRDERYYHISNSPVQNRDGTVSKLTIYRDITRLKTIEAQLNQAQKLEAIGTLAGGIAHDFNNLLMSIQGNTSLLLYDMGPDSAGFNRLKSIEENVKSAALLTNQLLGFARGGKYEIRPTDINALIKKTSRMFGRTRKEIFIREDLNASQSVNVDPGQIEQVLLNLLMNAWQAMPDGGAIRIVTRDGRLDEKAGQLLGLDPGDYVCLSVTDTGVGIAPETLGKIFDPFFTTKKLSRGTGLGLSSAMGIVKNHGGAIVANSLPDQGATFQVWIPACDEPAQQEKVPEETVTLGLETILMVDDEPWVLDTGAALLEALGYTVVKAQSGRQAVEIYARNKDSIDMVVLDMIMPEMDGAKVYAQLKELAPGVRVLLSSGYSLDGQASELLDQGCRGFLQKPFSLEEFSQKIREVLDGE